MAAPFHQSTDAHEDSDIVGKTMQDNVDPKNGSETEDVVENSGKGKVVPFVSTAKLIKNRHNNHIDRDTVAASRTDQDVVTDIIDNIDTIERVAKSASLLRHVAPEAAKHQRDTRLAAAKQGFDMSLLKIKPVPVPANDNIVQTLPVPVNDNAVSFKETESWPLIDQLNRTIFEPDETKRQKFIGTVHHIRDLIDTARADPLGLSVHRPGKEATPDHDLQRMESGKVWFEQSQTLDRRERTYDYRDGEIDAKRFDGPVRTAKRSPGAVSNGFDSNRDDPFAQRRIDAQIKLEDMAAVVGPVWLPLLDAVCANAGFTGIAAGFGYKQPVVGSAFVKLALETATRFLETRHEASSFRAYVKEHGLPVAARRYERALQDAQPAKIDHLQAKLPAVTSM